MVGCKQISHFRVLNIYRGLSIHTLEVNTPKQMLVCHMLQTKTLQCVPIGGGHGGRNCCKLYIDGRWDGTPLMNIYGIYIYI